MKRVLTITALLITLVLISTFVFAAVNFKKISFEGDQGKIKILSGMYKKDTLSSSVPFNLSNYHPAKIQIWGDLKFVDSESSPSVQGTVTVFSKGSYDGIGHFKFLDDGPSDVKLNAVAKFNNKNSKCTSFTSSQIICSSNSSKVIVFIPSHEDLKFFLEFPNIFILNITGNKTSVSAGFNSSSDILKIDDFTLSKQIFKEK